MANIDIKDLDRAAVLATLYNASAPRGLGFMQFDDNPFTVETAREELARRTYFDYLRGRPLKVDLSSEGEFDPRGFDRDNGGDGTAALLIDQLRESGDVNPLSSQLVHHLTTRAAVLEAMETFGGPEQRLARGQRQETTVFDRIAAALKAALAWVTSPFRR